MRDPYSPPKSDVSPDRAVKPKEVSFALWLIALSLLFYVLNVYVDSLTEDGLALSDPFNIGFNFVWFLIIAWLTNSISTGSSNPANTLLFLALIVFILNLQYDEHLFVTITGFAEGFCFLVCGLVLKSKNAADWFVRQ